MITVLRAIEMLTSVNYRELYRAQWPSPPPGRVENSNKESPPLLPKGHIPNEPQTTVTTRMLYRLSGSSIEFGERDLSKGKMMQQIYYQDAYCSGVRLEYPDIQFPLSEEEDAEVRSSSSYFDNKRQSVSSYQRRLQADIKDTGKDVTNSSSSRYTNSISSDEGRDEEAVSDVLEIIRTIQTQPFSECETLWLEALRDAERTSTVEALNEPQTPPRCTSYVSSAPWSITNQESSASLSPKGDHSNSSATDEAGSTSPLPHVDATQGALSRGDPSTCEKKGSPSQLQNEEGPSNQENVQPGGPFEGVVQRMDVMVAQPLAISGATSSMLPRFQAMGYAEGRAPRPRQPTPLTRRQSRRANQPSLPMASLTSAAAEQSIAEATSLAATPSMIPPTSSRTSTPSLCIRLTADTQPIPPPPVQNANNKRRLVNDEETPQEINAKTQRKGPSPPTAASAPRPSSVFPAPLPAESSFIPVLHERELEDVMREGTPIRLGKGVFGEVLLKKRILDGSLVAVKQLLDVKDSMEAYKEMIKEIRTMMAVQHLNEFPKVLGIIDQEKFAIEFVGDPVTKTSRDLKSVLANPPANLETLDWIQICIDMSRGLLALHDAGWSHNDLHNGNVMVWCDVSRSNKWAAKIIDLGLATRIDLPLPPFMFDSAKKSWCHKKCPHLPPEVIEGVCQQGSQSDVYSLGHMFRTISDKNAELSFIRDLGEKCGKRMPHDRPPMDSVVKDIEKFHREMKNKKMGTRGRVTGFR